MNKVIFWGILSSLAVLSVYLISDILIPFLIAFIFAYILQPVIRFYCKKFSASKKVITLIIFILFISIFIAILVLLSPIIYNQFVTLISKIPTYKYKLNEIISSGKMQLEDTDPEFTNKIVSSLQSIVDGVLGLFSSFANHIWDYTVATINFFTITALVPIILFYFLKDWDKINKNIQQLLPQREQGKAKEILHSINELLSIYIRGQLNICMILTFYYIIGLSIIGIDSALLLGIISGFLIIIPFIGAIISFLLVIISCYFSFGAGIEFLYASILFIVGHAIEGYILTPKIIGNRIGLHPLWVVFAVFSSAHLFGIIGILFAIPVAGIIKIFLCQLVEYYKSSDLYK